MIFLYFQVQNYDCVIVINYNDTACQNKSVYGFKSKECIQSSIEEDSITYSCWKAHHWYGVMAIIFMYMPANDIISAVIGPGVTTILSPIWSLLLIVVGVILMGLDIEIIGCDAKWIGLFLLLLEGATFFLDILHYARFYSSMKESFQSKSMREKIVIYVYQWLQRR